MTEEEVVAAARCIHGASDRAAYLDQACAADADLRRRVEAALRSAAEEGRADKPALEQGVTSDVAPGRWIDPAAMPPLAEDAGSRIGPFKLLQKLGEGGMGTVFLAEQLEPVQRRVALKIIKAGMDSARVVARFEAERQALAMMDHPNIAKVLDAGTTAGGRPYFVMDLVKGIPITRFCDQERLTLKQRLELFIGVCQAVQHAHQKGIIHRDLKPSNVLVALYDGKPVPKVIDFGLAKATAQKLTERTMVTEVGQIVGTLEYMAPEQAELNNLDIDTRADIYSLGVLLYELLTGSPPFTARQLRGEAFTEMLRLIHEVEPPRPSTRLSSSEELPRIAAQRKLEPAKLARLVRGDLDWIAMKCLEKERARRYETANGLALDVQRYLADEPVSAGPPSTRYRLRKFFRRHRHGVTAAGLLLVTLLAGLAGTSWGLVQARWERDRAVNAEGQARDQAGKARANFELARNAVEEYGSKVSGDSRLKEKDLEELRKELLQSAIKFHQQFLEQHRDDPALRADLGRACHDLGKLIAQTGKPTAALDLFEKGAALYEQLITEHPEEGAYPLQLADTLTCQGEALDDGGQTKEARAAYERALETLESARQRHESSSVLCSEYARACGCLGYLLRHKVGSKEAAIATYRKGIAFSEAGRPAGAVDLENVIQQAYLCQELGGTLSEMGQAPQGLLCCKKALALQEPLLTKTNRPRQLLQGLTYSYASIGRVYVALSKPQQALEALRKAVDIDQELVAAHPSDSRYQSQLGTDYNALALVLFASGQRLEGLTVLGKSLEVKEQLVARHPDVPDYKANLARSLLNLAVRTADVKEARGYLQRAEALLKELIDRYPKVTQYQHAFAAANVLRRQLHLGVNEPPQAQEAKGKALEAPKELAKLVPTEARLRHQLGTLLMEQGRLDEALEAFKRALALKADYAEAQCDLGHCLVRQGRFTEGRDALQRGHELGSKQAGWNHPSAQWVRNADALIRLDGRLATILEGKAQAANNSERLALALLCQQNKRLYAAATRFYAEAFAAEPKLAENLEASHRYNAACAATLAGCGQGEDASKLDAGKRADLRKQALEWLRSDLAAWGKRHDDPKYRQQSHQVLQHWPEDDDLAGVRDADALAKLPPDERKAWQDLWSKVADLLNKPGD
jgi:serine/threonine protein kinase/tetratricopeptide (TPR) repeat protein